MNTKPTKKWKGNILVLAISLSLFGFLTIKSLRNYRQLIHQSVHGIVTDSYYDKEKSAYLYQTNKDEVLNGNYFFNDSSDLKLDINDYIIKFPHSLDLYILNLREDGDYYLKGKIVGTYK